MLTQEIKWDLVRRADEFAPGCWGCEFNDRAYDHDRAGVTRECTLLRSHDHGIKGIEPDYCMQYSTRERDFLEDLRGDLIEELDAQEVP